MADEQEIQTGADGWTLERIKPIVERNNCVFVRFTNEGKSFVFYHKDDPEKKEKRLPLPTRENFEIT